MLHAVISIIAAMTSSFLLMGAESNISYIEISTCAEPAESKYLFQEKKELSLLADLRIEQAWSYTFIGGLTGTTLGSLMAGAGCIAGSVTVNPHLCTAGIAIASIAGFVTVCGAGLGIGYVIYKNCALTTNHRERPEDEN